MFYCGVKRTENRTRQADFPQWPLWVLQQKSWGPKKPFSHGREINLSKTADRNTNFCNVIFYIIMRHIIWKKCILKAKLFMMSSSGMLGSDTAAHAQWDH